MHLTKTDLRREMRAMRECLTRTSKDLQHRTTEAKMDRVLMHLHECTHHLSKLRTMATTMKRDVARNPPRKRRKRR